MAIPDPYSNRRKKERGELPDVFVYDQLSGPLRTQIAYILRDALGEWYSEYGEPPSRKAYTGIFDALVRHLGRKRLSNHETADRQIENFVESESNIELVMDAIELSVQMIESVGVSYQYRTTCKCRLTPEGAIHDLNDRFLQHGIGYRYESGQIRRIDSEYLHANVTKPTLALLLDKPYEGANDEFLKAHEHYRKGEVKECLANSLKALESTLKTICVIRNWTFQPTDTAKPLLDLCFANGLMPKYLQSQYAALRNVLESGVPTVSNKTSRHGQGAEVVEVPMHYGAYALHLTGSTILFLVESEKALS